MVAIPIPTPRTRSRMSLSSAPTEDQDHPQAAQRAQEAGGGFPRARQREDKTTGYLKLRHLIPAPKYRFYYAAIT